MGKEERRMEQIERIIGPERRKEEEKTKIMQSFAGYRDEIEELLRKESYQELAVYFQTEKMYQICHMENEAAIMNLILNIYEMEIQEGVESGILNEIHNMKSAVDWYLKVKFLMWRLEFLDEKNELSRLLQEDRVSVPFMKYLVYTSSFEKADTSYKLAMLLKQTGGWGKAFAMLNYVNELMPNQEIVFCEMADICMQLGQLEDALNCLKNIKNPSEILVRYYEKWGI